MKSLIFLLDLGNLALQLLNKLAPFLNLLLHFGRDLRLLRLLGLLCHLREGVFRLLA